MSSTICGAPHPTAVEFDCERASGTHEMHTALDLETLLMVDWRNEGYVKPAPTKEARTRREGRTRKKLKDMAIRITGGNVRHTPTYYPTESDMRGRTALYLMKYPNEWVGLDELEMKTVGGKGALRSIKELTHHYGWEIAQKIDENGDPTHFQLQVQEEH